MKYVRPAANTLFVIADHYKGSMRKATRWDGYKPVTTWAIKIYLSYGSSNVEYVDDVKAAYNRLRFLVHDYEEDYKVWGRML